MMEGKSSLEGKENEDGRVWFKERLEKKGEEMEFAGRGAQNSRASHMPSFLDSKDVRQRVTTSAVPSKAKDRHRAEGKLLFSLVLYLPTV